MARPKLLAHIRDSLAELQSGLRRCSPKNRRASCSSADAVALPHRLDRGRQTKPTKATG
jgi:hypothetical protein